MRRAVLAVVIGAVLATAAYGLDLKEGLVRLVVDQSDGRFSLYRLVDVAKSRYVALFYDRDPRTSFATLSIDGRLVRLGDDSDYRISVARTDTGVVIEFRSTVCAVKESLDFARSAGSPLADGLRVTFDLENLSARDERLGLRFLIDTYLGEKSGIHFVTNRRLRVSRETSISASSPDTWIETPGKEAGFMIQLSGPGIDRPDRVILANWKRLSDAPWSFDVNPRRDFTLMPYSINDSAMALFWEPSLVARGQSRPLRFAMGSFDALGYPPAGSGGDGGEIQGSSVPGASAAVRSSALETDMVAVRDLIAKIDRALSSGAPLSADEIAAWQKTLSRLEERKKDY